MSRRNPSNRDDRHPEPSHSAAEPGFAVEAHGTMLLLWISSLVLMSLMFAPIGLWPLSFVCLVPWLVLVGASSQAPRVYFHSFVFGLAFFLINMRWMYEATGLGYLALTVYQAAYIPFVAIPLRHVVRRRGWPLAMTLPFVWTGCEMLRAVVISGFPWFYLSHSLHGVLTLIQVSDLVGAYGVTFMVAAVNGAIADLVFATMAARRTGQRGVCFRGARGSLIFACVLVVGVVVYGQVQLRRGTTEDGPKVAVIQGDFINSVYADRATGHDRASERDKLLIYLSMIDAAAAEQPDMYVLPETPWFMYLNPEWRELDSFSRVSFEELQRRATRDQAVLVTGSATHIPTPYDLLAEERRHNSATVFHPDGSEPGRYDKIHLVYFGEVVPFRFGRFRFLYFWLNRIMPFSGPDGDIEYSVFRGESFRRFPFEARSRGGKLFRFGIPICYEDVMPYVSREFACGASNEKKADFLVNISNDGWFGRGIRGERPQQWQHLAICVFRAVENRVGVARAVNTGISGFIQPSGRVHDVVHGDPDSPWPGECGFSVAHVGVDSRLTLYSRYGDWFAWGCAFLWLLLFVDYWIHRVRTRIEE